MRTASTTSFTRATLDNLCKPARPFQIHTSSLVVSQISLSTLIMIISNQFYTLVCPDLSGVIMWLKNPVRYVVRLEFKRLNPGCNVTAIWSGASVTMTQNSSVNMYYGLTTVAFFIFRGSAQLPLFWQGSLLWVTWQPWHVGKTFIGNNANQWIFCLPLRSPSKCLTRVSSYVLGPHCHMHGPSHSGTRQLRQVCWEKT